MTRPRGTIRQALSAAAWSLHREQQAFHWRDLLGAADIGRSLSTREQVSLVKQTVRDMTRAGELKPVGTVRTEHACRPMVLYEPCAAADAFGAAASAGAELVQAMRCWAEFK